MPGLNPDAAPDDIVAGANVSGYDLKPRDLCDLQHAQCPVTQEIEHIRQVGDRP